MTAKEIKGTRCNISAPCYILSIPLLSKNTADNFMISFTSITVENTCNCDLRNKIKNITTGFFHV